MPGSFNWLSLCRNCLYVGRCSNCIGLTIGLIAVTVINLCAAAEKCPPANPKEPMGELTFPRNLRQAFCSASLSASNAQNIFIDFTKLGVDRREHVLYDYVLLFGGSDCMSPRFAVTSGGRKSTYVSPSNRMSSLFITDFEGAKEDFIMKYSPRNATGEQEPEEKDHPAISNLLHNCGEEMNINTSNTIFWKSVTETNVLCIWRIRNTKGGKILLTIHELQLRDRLVYIQILDGHDCSAKAIQKFSGNEVTKTTAVETSSDAMVIALVAPLSFRSRFNASFSFVSKAQLNRTNPTAVTLGLLLLIAMLVNTHGE